MHNIDMVHVQCRKDVVRRAIKLLGNLVTEQRRDFFIPTIFQRAEYVSIVITVLLTRC